VRLVFGGLPSRWTPRRASSCMRSLVLGQAGQFLPLRSCLSHASEQKGLKRTQSSRNDYYHSRALALIRYTGGIKDLPLFHRQQIHFEIILALHIWTCFCGIVLFQCGKERFGFSLNWLKVSPKCRYNKSASGFALLGSFFWFLAWILFPSFFGKIHYRHELLKTFYNHNLRNSLHLGTHS